MPYLFLFQAPTSQNSTEPPVKKAKVEGKLLMQADSCYAYDNCDNCIHNFASGKRNETEKRQQV